LASARIRRKAQRKHTQSGFALATVGRAMIALFRELADGIGRCSRRVWSRLAPLPDSSATLGLATDACRPRHQLLVENALLRHQLIILRRKCSRPKLTRADRLRLLLAASLIPGWRKAVALVQPATVLRWHRCGFRMFWRFKSRPVRRTHPGRASQARHSRQQAYRPEVHAPRSLGPTQRSALVDVSAQPRR
jgi:hypothetical protein